MKSVLLGPQVDPNVNSETSNTDQLENLKQIQQELIETRDPKMVE